MGCKGCREQRSELRVRVVQEGPTMLDGLAYGLGMTVGIGVALWAIKPLIAKPAQSIA